MRLSLFTSFYSTSIGRNVILLNYEFGTYDTSELLSITNLIGRLLTKAAIMKNFGPLLFVDRVDCTFCFTEWFVFGVQLSPPALLVSASIRWFTFLFARQHLAKWAILPYFAHFVPLTGHSCCLVFRLFRYRIFFSSSVSGESFNFSCKYSCIASVIPSTDISLFRIFFFRS